MKTILFYWSKGADTRVRIIREVGRLGGGNKPCYLNSVAETLGISHTAAKKHIDLLVEEKYLRVLNPGGKPLFLELTDSGKDVLSEFSHGRKK
jgi:predicted ArsR family transcriptional regulator